MDDDFLSKPRREPRPEFARKLRARLREIEDGEPVAATPWLRPALAAAFTIALVSVLFTLPAVRATAQQVLDLFRVQEFAPVQVSAERLEQLRTKTGSFEQLLGGQHAVEEHPPGPPQAFTSVDAAAAAAGFTPATPEILPRQIALDTVFVSREGSARFTVDTKPLRELMEAFDVRDLTLPPGLDGGTVSLHTSPMVVQRYRNPRFTKVALLQSKSPEVSLPAGTDLSRLGEIALRLFGLDPAEASRLARAIDWRSTLVVPVVASATSYRQVTVNGDRGLFMESNDTVLPDGRPQKGGAVVMWNRNGYVYALVGNLDRFTIMQMAESVH
jgi:hypothetical protein